MRAPADRCRMPPCMLMVRVLTTPLLGNYGQEAYFADLRKPQGNPFLDLTGRSDYRLQCNFVPVLPHDDFHHTLNLLNPRLERFWANALHSSPRPNPPHPYSPVQMMPLNDSSSTQKCTFKYVSKHIQVQVHEYTYVYIYMYNSSYIHTCI